MKATVIVEGKVQGVGFRLRVRQLAAEYGMHGLVRNLRNGQVEVFAEFSNKSSFKRFASKLGEPFGHPLLERAQPSKLDIYLEGQAGFRGPWKDYSGFEIDSDYG